MSRSHFGATSTDWLLKPYRFGGSTLVALRSGTTLLNFYSAQTGGTHYTDLLDSTGAATTQITVTDYQIPGFQGPDGILAMWADKGDGSPREYMEAQDAAAAAAAVTAAAASATAAAASAAAAANKVDKDTLTVLAPRATGSNQLSALQTAIDSAAALGLWLALNGDHQISGELAVPSGAKIDGTRGTITQTGSLKTVFLLTNVAGVQIRDVVANGKTSDYVNNSSVFAAAGVYVSGTTSDVRIDNCRFLGMAGAGVRIAGTASDVHVTGCKMTGAGASYILNTTYNYSGGIITDTGSANWSAHRNDISGFAQGIGTGDNMIDVRITNNRIHDIPGQHGLYLETVNGGVISNNVVRNTGLTGMKIQVGTTSVNDVDTVTISDNCFINAGAQGILLTNPVGGTPRLRRIDVTGNLLTTIAGKAIEANNCVGLHVADNIIYNATQGIGVNDSTQFDLSDNRIHLCSQNGITITDCTDAAITSNRIIDPGTANNASAEFGIHILGSTSADLTVHANKVTDSGGNMRYGIYIAAGDQTTMDITGNRASGATDYGFRGVTSTAARAFRDNAFSGTTGPILALPTGTTSFERSVALPASTTLVASVNVPHGSAPTSPVNGDMWTTTAGLFVRVNGATVGPLT